MAIVLLVLAAAACERRTSPAESQKAPPATSSPSAAATSSLDQPRNDGPARFVPSVHGFAFANQFPGVGLPTFVVGWDSKATSTGRAFGLCGGMAAAAADYFRAGRLIPATSRVPRRGTYLYEYLYLRQAESIGPGIATALKFVESMSQSDVDLRHRTMEELKLIRAALHADSSTPFSTPTPIGLILARFGGPPGASTPADNHQVLALAMHETESQIVIEVYDPNYPGDDAVRIELNLGDDGPRSRAFGQLVRPGGRPTPVRGVIAVPYQPRLPPLEPA